MRRRLAVSFGLDLCVCRWSPPERKRLRRLSPRLQQDHAAETSGCRKGYRLHDLSQDRSCKNGFHEIFRIRPQSASRRKNKARLRGLSRFVIENWPQRAGNKRRTFTPSRHSRRESFMPSRRTNSRRFAFAGVFGFLTSRMKRA